MKSLTIFFSLLLASCMACGESLPTGYVQSGGLLWAPIKTKDIWTNIAGSGVCTRENPVGALGYTSGWRQPTREELLALYAAYPNNSPELRAQGWILSYTWSSTIGAAGDYEDVSLYDGSVHRTFIRATIDYVSCVHNLRKR